MFLKNCVKTLLKLQHRLNTILPRPSIRRTPKIFNSIGVWWCDDCKGTQQTTTWDLYDFKSIYFVIFDFKIWIYFWIICNLKLVIMVRTEFSDHENEFPITRKLKTRFRDRAGDKEWPHSCKILKMRIFSQHNENRSWVPFSIFAIDFTTSCHNLRAQHKFTAKWILITR